MFEKILKFFRLKLYTKKQIGDFVQRGVITAQQYEQITGEAYPNVE